MIRFIARIDISIKVDELLNIFLSRTVSYLIGYILLKYYRLTYRNDKEWR